MRDEGLALLQDSQSQHMRPYVKFNAVFSWSVPFSARNNSAQTSLQNSFDV